MVDYVRRGSLSYRSEFVCEDYERRGAVRNVLYCGESEKNLYEQSLWSNNSWWDVAAHENKVV